MATLMLKNGAQAFAKSRLGQRVGAAAANSPTVKWLDERQRMTKTTAAVRSALNRPGNAPTPGLAMAGASSRSGDAVTRPPAAGTVDRMTSGTPQGASATGAASGRVRFPVKGLYQQLNMTKPPSGWNFTNQTWTERGAHVIQTQVQGPGGTKGTFQRGYDPVKKTVILDEAFLEDLPKWIDTPGAKLDPKKGIPTTTYMSLYQMRQLGVPFGQAQKMKMSTIQNFDTILQLEALRRKGIPIDQAVLQTHSVSYAETIVIQSGHQITGAKVETSGAFKNYTVDYLMSYYENALKDPIRRAKLRAEHDALLVKYGIDRSEKVLMNFDIELELSPLAPGQVAKPLVHP